jgi:hypothetical protein
MLRSNLRSQSPEIESNSHNYISNSISDLEIKLDDLRWISVPWDRISISSYLSTYMWVRICRGKRNPIRLMWQKIQSNSINLKKSIWFAQIWIQFSLNFCWKINWSEFNPFCLIVTLNCHTESGSACASPRSSSFFNIFFSIELTGPMFVYI